MNEKARNALVGFFVVASLAALGVLMVWFGETPKWLRQSEWTLRITGVRDLQGIGEGSPINLNGVEIGRVDQLEFEDISRPDQGVAIVAGIEKRYSIPVGATARVFGATLGFGGGRVEIIVEPGVEAVALPKDNARIPGEMRSVIGELISKDLVNSVERAVANIANLTGEWTPVGSNLSTLLEQRSVAAVERGGIDGKPLAPNVATIVERLDQLVRNVNAVLGDQDVQGDLRTAVGDLKSATTQLREILIVWTRESRRLSDNLNDGVDRAEQHLDLSFTKLNHVLDNLDAAASSLANVLTSTAQGKGTAGLFAHDERLYEAAVLSLLRFSEVMQNLLVITGKIKEDGYITLGRAPMGFPRITSPIPLDASKLVE